MRGIGALLLVIGMTAGACGEQDGQTDNGDPAEPETVAILSGPAAGGVPTATPTMLGDERALRSYVSRFERGGLAAEVSRAYHHADMSAGGTLAAAVVALGCDVPPGVDIIRTASGYRIRPQPVASPLQECFAPVTSVALVRLPASQ